MLSADHELLYSGTSDKLVHVWRVNSTVAKAVEAFSSSSSSFSSSSFSSPSSSSTRPSLLDDYTVLLQLPKLEVLAARRHISSVRAMALCDGQFHSRSCLCIGSDESDIQVSIYYIQFYYILA